MLRNTALATEGACKWQGRRELVGGCGSHFESATPPKSLFSVVLPESQLTCKAFFDTGSTSARWPPFLRQSNYTHKYTSRRPVPAPEPTLFLRFRHNSKIIKVALARAWAHFYHPNRPTYRHPGCPILRGCDIWVPLPVSLCSIRLQAPPFFYAQPPWVLWFSSIRMAF